MNKNVKTVTMSDDEREANIQKGVKLKSDRSTIPHPLKETPSEAFDKRVNDSVNNNERIKTEAWELSSKFVKILQDTTLPENRGPIQKDHEKNIINKLISIAIDLNTDETQKEGIGSVGLATLLFNCVLKQRDIINQLRYDCSIISDRLLRLEKLNGSKE